MGSDVLTSEEAANVIGVSEYTMRQWRREGHGPQWLRITDGPKGGIRYRRESIDEWLKAREAQEEGKR